MKEFWIGFKEPFVFLSPCFFIKGDWVLCRSCDSRPCMVLCGLFSIWRLSIDS